MASLKDWYLRALMVVAPLATKAQDMPIATIPTKPVLELKDAEPAMPEMEGVAQYNDSIPTWRELFDEGKLKFTAGSSKLEMLDPDNEDIKYVHAMHGVGHVIDVMLRDEKYGEKFSQALSNRGKLEIHLEDNVFNALTEEGILQLDINKNGHFILHPESGKLAPLSKSHTAAHELLHFIHAYSDAPKTKAELIRATRIPGYHGSEEGRTVAKTDDFMRRNFGEPFARESYTTIATIDSLIHLQPDYYCAGEKWELREEALPEAKEYLEEIKLGMLASFLNKDWSKISDIATFGKAAQHLRKYYEKHGAACELEEFDRFVEIAPAITKEMAQMILEVKKAIKDDEVTPQEISKLEKLDKKLTQVKLSYEAPKTTYLAVLEKWMVDPSKIKFTVEVVNKEAAMPFGYWESNNAKRSNKKFQPETPEVPNIPKGPSRF